MARWTTAFPSYPTLYSFVEVTDWAIKSDRVTFDLSGGITSSYYWNVGGIGCTLGWWESGTYHTIDTDTVSYNRNGGDLTVFSREDYFARQDDDRTVYLYHEGSASGTAYAESSAYTVPHKAPVPSGLTATRASDTQVDLSWTNPSRSYEAMCIEVSTDGGSWSEVVALFNTSSSWSWNGAAPDHSYRFRIRTYYKANYSAYHTWDGTITMAPAPPSSITTAAAGGTNIDVTLDNPSPVATKVQYQISTDGGSNWGNVTDADSLTSFTISASGTVRIRVRNWNATGESAWLQSDPIVTITPPNPPTLVSPSSNVINMSDGSVTFEWRHNPLDGSAQTAAQLDYEDLDYEDASDTKTINGDAQSYNQPISDEFAVGDRIKWRMRTKGADASYGEWSEYRTFTFYTAPTLSIASPSATVTGMPISLSATYSDMAGFTCQAATVSLRKDGRTLYTEAATISGTSITASLDVSEFLPTNGESYTVVLTARSSSGLSTSANATFTVAFTEPQAGELTIANDPETGYVSLLATFDNDGSDIEYSGNTNTQYDCEPAYVKSLTVEGQSAKWNQLVKYPSNANNWYVNNATNGATTTSISNNALVLTSADASNSTSQLIIRAAMEPIKSGHKYYFEANASSNQMLGRFNLLDNWTVLGSSTDVNGLKSAIITATGDGSTYPYASITFKPNDSSFSHPVGSTVTLYGFACIDLTAIFGSGNEPATVDAFKATDVYKAKLAAGELYDYDAGSLVSIGSVSVGDGTITTPLRSAGTIHDRLVAGKDEWTVERKVGTRAYQSGDESDPDVLTDGTTTYYALTTPTTDTPASYTTIQLGTAFTVGTELDSTFSMTSWDGAAEADTISVSRVNADGTTTPLLTDGQSGAGIVDKYAPLNTAYQYAITTASAAKAIKTVYVDNLLESDRWFAYWTAKVDETTVERMASAKWNPDNGGIQLSRPQKVRVFYAGRKDPVSYDGSAVSLTETPSWLIIDRDEIQPFVQLIEDGGRGVYKSCDGWVYHADFDLTLTPKYTAIGYYGGVGLTVTRIAGDLL